jgi:C-terminal processing protease CtpA/Prc
MVATEDGVAKGRYFVFMADTNSASCSETMLMGVTNTTQAPIVGMLTYGKGIGQYNIPTGAGGLSMITAMKLYDKNNVSYHDKGIVPDYAISDTLKALDKAVEIAKLGKEKRSKGYGTEKQGHFENSLAKKASSAKEPARGGAYKLIKNPLMK